MKWQHILLTPAQRKILERLVRISDPPQSLIPVAIEVERMLKEQRKRARRNLPRK